MFKISTSLGCQPSLPPSPPLSLPPSLSPHLPLSLSSSSGLCTLEKFGFHDTHYKCSASGYSTLRIAPQTQTTYNEQLILHLHTVQQYSLTTGRITVHVIPLVLVLTIVTKFINMTQQPVILFTCSTNLSLICQALNESVHAGMGVSKLLHHHTELQSYQNHKQVQLHKNNCSFIPSIIYSQRTISTYRVFPFQHFPFMESVPQYKDPCTLYFTPHHSIH